jgi:hypothetical protein
LLRSPSVCMVSGPCGEPKLVPPLGPPCALPRPPSPPSPRRPAPAHPRPILPLARPRPRPPPAHPSPRPPPPSPGPSFPSPPPSPGPSFPTGPTLGAHYRCPMRPNPTPYTQMDFYDAQFHALSQALCDARTPSLLALIFVFLRLMYKRGSSAALCSGCAAFLPSGIHERAYIYPPWCVKSVPRVFS